MHSIYAVHADSGWFDIIDVEWYPAKLNVLNVLPPRALLSVSAALGRSVLWYRSVVVLGVLWKIGRSYGLRIVVYQTSGRPCVTQQARAAKGKYSHEDDYGLAG